MQPQVNILGQDLYDLGYVNKLDGINEMKSFQKDKLTSNQYNIPVRNTDNYFSINNPDSFFNNIDWLYEDIEIIGRNGEKIWDGVLTNIERNHVNKTATLKTRSSFFKYRNEKIEYTSDGWETGAESFKNICDNAGFTSYNMKSVQDSINRLTDAECYILVSFDLKDNINFQSAIEKLGEYSNADVYSSKQEVYFVHWIPEQFSATITINESDYRRLPTVIEDERELINDYSIGYDGDGGTPATDSNSNNIGNISRTKYGIKSLPEMRSGENTQIMYKDKTSAIYIGEGYIRRTHKNLSTQPAPLTKIQYELAADYRNYTDLQSYLKNNLSDEGWTEKYFETFEFSVNEDNNIINITAYEVV